MSDLIRAFFLSLALITGATVPSAGQERSTAFTPGYGPAKAPAVARAKPCEAEGPGFRAMPGGSSCIRVFGGVRVEGRTRTVR